MRSAITATLVGTVCLAVGLCVGLLGGPQLKTTEAGRWVETAASKVPWAASGNQSDESQIESNEYPTLKWRPRPISDAPDAIVRLWTTFEPGAKGEPQGTLKYKLTLFKATKKDVREVQLLDSLGFKLLQFNAADFHDMPGAPDIVESRDSVPCAEDLYKKARDYSVK